MIFSSCIKKIEKSLPLFDTLFDRLFDTALTGSRPLESVHDIRLSQDVPAHFKAAGRGWRTRINENLREWGQNQASVKSSHARR